MAQSEHFMEQAKAMLLANRYAYGPNRGPSGSLIYTIGNEVDERGLPRLNPDNQAPPEIYYAMIATNRTGIEVITPASGSIDLMTDVAIGSEEPHRVTLSKLNTKDLTEALEKLKAIDGISFDTPAKATADQLAEILVAKLLEGNHKVAIEDPVVAGIREGNEECSDAAEKKPLIAPEFYELHLVSKRAIQAAEGGRKLAEKKRFLYQLDDINNLSDIQRVLETGFHGVETATQGMVVAGIADAQGLALRDDTKVDSSTGYPVYERGKFVTLRHMREQLESSIAEAKAITDPEQRNFAREELAATGDRLRQLVQIEANLLSRFEAQDVHSIASVAKNTAAMQPIKAVENHQLPEVQTPLTHADGFAAAIPVLQKMIPNTAGNRGEVDSPERKLSSALQ